MNKIRNLSIIAHIDHGKSTISDRLIQACGGLSKREMSTQVLDSMDIERERGITIKSQSVTLYYKSINSNIYQLNIIDTPGHVDFSYEVSRSLYACEGALLVVDANQGVEAQTLANCYTALEMNLKIIPVLNKIDLPTAEPTRVIKEINQIIGIDTSKVVKCSAKTGKGIIDVLESLVQYIPPPIGNPQSSLQAIIIDSWFDNYWGVVSLIRIKNGQLNQGNKIKLMSTGEIYTAEQLGIFTPKKLEKKTLKCGEIGWLVCRIKNIYGAPVGDTITEAYNPANQSLPGFKKSKPQVYASIFPISNDYYDLFRDALIKLSLNDASLFYEPRNSTAFGSGFFCGFLGLLHMEIIQERLEREYNLQLIITTPTVIYEIITTNHKTIYIDNPTQLPTINNIYELREPIVTCNMLLPKIYLGNVMKLCIEKRGILQNIIYYDKQVSLTYDIPMAEVILNFFDRLKSISSGYASLDYNFKFFKKSDMIKIDILINHNQVDALSIITHRDKSFSKGRNLVHKLQEIIPRQQFDIIIQAAIGKTIIARSTVKQLRKHVISKCYGGDVSRKKKLLKKQKEGKKRMKQLGKVELPQAAFLAILHIK